MSIQALFLLRRLKNNLKYSSKELELLQSKKLSQMLLHAYNNVAYYKSLFDSAGIKPSDIKNRGDLKRLPSTSKLKLQSLAESEITARNIDLQNCIRDITSGSTGIPLKVYYTKKDHLIRSLLFIRTFMNSGYRLTDRQAIVCDTRFASNEKHWFQYLGLFNKRYIPVQAELDEQVSLLRDFRPDYIHGYPLSIALIAGEIIRKGINDIKPRMVCTGAELVSNKTRKLINKAFSVDMRDTYATIESGMVAWECVMHKGYHINMDNIAVEFIKDGRPALPGESGNVLLTNLNSFAMPIIRYEIGDICVPSDDQCTCGIKLPLMKIVEGRVDDMVFTPNGNTISPNSITNAMEAVEGIRQFRVIQEESDYIEVHIIKGKGFTGNTAEMTRNLLSGLIGSNVKIGVKIVGKIEREASGKIRAVISRVPRKGRDGNG